MLSVRQAFQGLDVKTGKDFEKLSAVAAEPEKTPILSEDVNADVIVDFCMASLRAEGRTTPPRVEVVDAVQAFIAAFQGRLFEQRDYRDWMLQGAQWNWPLRSAAIVFMSGAFVREEK